MDVLRIRELEDRIIEHIETVEDNGEVIKLIFHMADKDIVSMSHPQECCEHVYLGDVVGDIGDLVGTPIIVAEGCTEEGNVGESSTWTFYHFRTVKGDVTFRWLGESNGYYSEGVRIAGSDFSYYPEAL